jgi:hypothetical protein
MTRVTSSQIPGPMESLFGNTMTLRIIDFLAVQKDSQTIADLSKGIMIPNYEVEVAIKQLVSSNVIGIDESKLAEVDDDNSIENNYYQIRTDSSSAVAIRHLYNYVNCMRKQTTMLYSTDPSIT